MSGVLSRFGTMALEGKPVRFNGTADAGRSGVVCIFQELSLIPDFTVAENICAPSRRAASVDRPHASDAGPKPCLPACMRRRPPDELTRIFPCPAAS